MEIIIVAALLGLIPAFIAQSRGRSFGLWWIYGFLLFIVALIHSLFITRKDSTEENSQLSSGMRKCPFCAEAVKTEAIKCKHCGSDIPKGSVKKIPDIDYDFLPSTIPVERYIKKIDGVLSVNSNEVVEMVNKLKSINVGVHPVNIKTRYADDIDFLRGKLPVGLREEFAMIYNSVLMN